MSSIQYNIDFSFFETATGAPTTLQGTTQHPTSQMFVATTKILATTQHPITTSLFLVNTKSVTSLSRSPGPTTRLVAMTTTQSSLLSTTQNHATTNRVTSLGPLATTNNPAVTTQRAAATSRRLETTSKLLATLLPTTSQGHGTGPAATSQRAMMTTELHLPSSQNQPVTSLLPATSLHPTAVTSQRPAIVTITPVVVTSIVTSLRSVATSQRSGASISNVPVVGTSKSQVTSQLRTSLAAKPAGITTRSPVVASIGTGGHLTSSRQVTGSVAVFNPQLGSSDSSELTTTDSIEPPEVMVTQKDSNSQNSNEISTSNGTYPWWTHV